MARKSKTPAGDRPPWARRLTEAKKKSGLSQTTLAKKVHKSQSAIGEYETGETEPNIATWEALANALGADPGFLAFGREPNQDDSALIAALLREKDNWRLFAAIRDVADMLDGEGIRTDLSFMLSIARKVALAAQGLEDRLEIRERIRLAAGEEQRKIRQGMDDLKKSLGQP